MTGFLTAEQLSKTFPLANLSALPTSNPGGGKPWLRGDGAIGVGAYTPAGVTWNDLAGLLPLDKLPAHTHGNLTSDGKIGSTAGLPIVTGAGGVLTAGTLNGTGNVVGTTSPTLVTPTLSGNILATANGTQNIGNTTNYFGTLHVGTIRTAGSLNLNTNGTGYGLIYSGNNGYWDTDSFNVRSAGGVLRTTIDTNGLTLHNTAAKIVCGGLTLQPNYGGSSRLHFGLAGINGFFFNPNVEYSMGPSTVLGWCSIANGPGNNAAATGISRVVDGTLAIGNGIAGNASGNLQLAGLTATTANFSGLLQSTNGGASFGSAWAGVANFEFYTHNARPTVLITASSSAIDPLIIRNNSNSNVFTVGNQGAVTAAGQVQGNTLKVGSDANKGIISYSTNAIAFNNSGANNLVIDHNAITIGNWSGATTSLSAASGGAGNANRAGNSLLLNAGQSTGSGAASYVAIQASPTGSAGSSSNGLVEVARFNGDLSSVFAGPIGSKPRPATVPPNVTDIPSGFAVWWHDTVGNGRRYAYNDAGLIYQSPLLKSSIPATPSDLAGVISVLQHWGLCA